MIRRFSKYALVILACAALLSCTDNPVDSGDGRPISITDAFVVDSDGFTSDGSKVSDLRPDDSSDEQFSLNWNVTGGRTPPIHRADWFISADEALQTDTTRPGVDVRILSRNCGIDFSDVCKQNVGRAGCRYQTDMSLYCGGLGALADRQATPLADYFADTKGLPGRYFLILRIQDPSNGETVIRSFPANLY